MQRLTCFVASKKKSIKLSTYQFGWSAPSFCPCSPCMAARLQTKSNAILVWPPRNIYTYCFHVSSFMGKSPVSINRHSGLNSEELNFYFFITIYWACNNLSDFLNCSVLLGGTVREFLQRILLYGDEMYYKTTIKFSLIITKT